MEKLRRLISLKPGTAVPNSPSPIYESPPEFCRPYPIQVVRIMHCSMVVDVSASSAVQCEEKRNGNVKEKEKCRNEIQNPKGVLVTAVGRQERRLIGCCIIS